MSRFALSLSLIATLVLACACSGTSAPPSTPATAAPTVPPITAAPAATSTPASTAAPAVTRNVAYMPGNLTQQQLDVYVPGGDTAAFPTLLLLHGGGATKESLSALAQHFVGLGYAVVVPNFRDTPATKYPEPVADVFCALAWTHANAAAYRLDTQRLFALGHSLGGTFAALLAMIDDPVPYVQDCPATLPAGARLQAVVTFTGIFDYTALAGATGGMQTYLHRYLGASYEQAPETWRDASPVTYLDGAEPPFLLVHGEKDSNIDPAQSRDFAAALAASGAQVELVLVPGADHTALLRDAAVLEKVDAFLGQP